ncbi:MAG: biotin--[acetyl-CoA-carboxylase] ligase [Aphanocapsa sp. GSE-SYN-MK-11-07L]|nr:biotin--[acetyl-CoA-carboxylase] ligase [Aphanocapsa sp. GSE-SYN-MK-11-07L]
MNDDWTQLPPWLHWLERCDSTNIWAIDHAAQLQPGDVIFTQQQTAGRGQQGRPWYAPAGVLTASFILDQIPVSQLPGLSLAAGLAVIYAIADLIPIGQDSLMLKWPNDVVCDRRKLAGILCEATSGSVSARVVVGIGLNRCVDFAEAGLETSQIGDPISLDQITSAVPDQLALLERLRHYLLQVADLFIRSGNSSENSGLTPLLPELQRRDALRDRTVTLDLPNQSITGQAVGIDAIGRLQIRTPDGQVQAFSSGRVGWA